METTTGGNSSSAPPPPSSSNTVNGGATRYLPNLPSRGNFTSYSATTVPSSNFGGMRVFITDRDTSPPEHQLIKTDTMNILIRALLLKKQNHKNDVVKAIAKNNNQSDTSAGGSSSTRKRGAAVADGGGRAKRAATEGEDSFQNLTVERLRAMLKEKGLSLKGKKDELIARLRSAS